MTDRQLYRSIHRLLRQCVKAGKTGYLRHGNQYSGQPRETRILKVAMAAVGATHPEAFARDNQSKPTVRAKA